MSRNLKNNQKNVQIHDYLLNSTKNLGGGTILDLGVYVIQVSLFAFGADPISIKATGKLNEDGVDVATNIELKFANGGIANLRTSSLEEYDNKATIKGTKGSITVSWMVFGMNFRNFLEFR